MKHIIINYVREFKASISDANNKVALDAFVQRLTPAQKVHNMAALKAKGYIVKESLIDDSYISFKPAALLPITKHIKETSISLKNIENHPSNDPMNYWMYRLECEEKAKKIIQKNTEQYIEDNFPIENEILGKEYSITPPSECSKDYSDYEKAQLFGEEKIEEDQWDMIIFS